MYEKVCKNLRGGEASRRPPPARRGLKTKPRCVLHLSWVGYIRTCALAQLQMCPLFSISETAGRIALKFGLWLETH